MSFKAIVICFFLFLANKIDSQYETEFDNNAFIP